MRPNILWAGIITAIAFGIGPSAALTQNTAYVDTEFGTDSASCGSAILGAGFSNAANGPCQTLNQALNNLSSGGGMVILERGGQYPPIYLAANAIIVGPADHSAVIYWAPGTLPGCIGMAAGGCNGSTNANYAVEIAAGSEGVMLENIVITGLNSPNGPVHISSAAGGVDMKNVKVLFSAGPQLVLVDSSQGSTLGITMTDCDIRSGSPGGGIVLAPSGNTEVKLILTRTIIQNAEFGVRLDSTLATGATGGTVLLAVDSELSEMTNSALSVVGPSANTVATASLVRTTLARTNGAAIKTSGPGAIVSLNQSDITQNNVGINIVGSSRVFSFQNNQIFGNGENGVEVDCEVGGAEESCASALTPVSQN
jgi:hypothetical protein